MWLLHFIYICRQYMNSTRYRDAILNSSAIWKYVILLSIEQDVLISLEYALLINHPYEYPFRAPQHSQSKGHINKKRENGNIVTLLTDDYASVSLLYSDRESNPDLLFRRELFYPLNYQSPYISLRSWCGG